jgi:hypothetical protein
MKSITIESGKVITIETEAFKQIIDKIDELQDSMNEKCKQHPLKEKWLDNQDVKKTLYISTRTLQDYRDNGTLPFSRIGGKIYYKASDIEKLLEKNYINLKKK